MTKPYEVQLNITCVDGMVEAIQGSDLKRVHGFLTERDHEGSSINLNVRMTPDSGVESYYDEEAYTKLHELELL